MKITELPTDKFADVLCDIVPAFTAISEDDEVAAALGEVYASTGAGAMVTIGLVVRKLLPLLCKKHRQETYEIIAAVSGKTVAQVAAQGIRETATDIKDLLNTDLMDFFTDAADTEES